MRDTIPLKGEKEPEICVMRDTIPLRGERAINMHDTIPLRGGGEEDT
jgi:hypothetical protein